ncbi:MAG: hypothetical protein H6701_17175, partial [Myxococcales bacterium]|nr:hypothetical protein [Myxococcales bacterium]
MTRAAIVVLAALGAAVVVRAASFYWGRDALALAVVGGIGLGLAWGMVELWLRAGAASRLGREVAGLPAVADGDVIAGASGPVRAWAAAVAGGQPAPGAPVGFVPYLVGLLVMLGLFGTFLGLVETLAGARGAMLAAADVSALRSGLAGPIDGLTRAFGTSVAGVASSAVLGLAAVWVRRAERQSRRALARWAGVALAGVSPAGRQLAALSALARWGVALPAAAEALAAAVAGLQGLAAS